MAARSTRLKLARELGAPVAQISAVKGTGLDAVPLFLNQCAVPRSAQKAEQHLTLPVLGNAASTHTWAAQVSRRTGYRAPLSAESSRKLDNVLLHRVWGPLLFLIVVIGVFEVVFSIGQPMSDGFGDLLAKMGNLVRPVAAGRLDSVAGSGRRVEGHLVGTGFPAPDSAALSFHRSARRLRVSGARGADCRSRDAHDRD